MSVKDKWQFLTVREVADKYFNGTKSYTTVRRLVLAGRIAAITVNGSYRISKHDLQAKYPM